MAAAVATAAPIGCSIQRLHGGASGPGGSTGTSCRSGPARARSPQQAAKESWIRRGMEEGRIPGEEGEERQGEGAPCVGSAVAGEGDEVEAGSHGRPEDRRGGAGEEGVGGDEGQRADCGEPLGIDPAGERAARQQPAQRTEEAEDRQGEVEAGDGEEVGEAAVGEATVLGLVDGAPLPEGEGFDQRGSRTRRKSLAKGEQEEPTLPLDGGEEAAGLVDHGDPPLHHAADAGDPLPRQGGPSPLRIGAVPGRLVEGHLRHNPIAGEQLRPEAEPHEETRRLHRRGKGPIRPLPRRAGPADGHGRHRADGPTGDLSLDPEGRRTASVGRREAVRTEGVGAGTFVGPRPGGRAPRPAREEEGEGEEGEGRPPRPQDRGADGQGCEREEVERLGGWPERQSHPGEPDPRREGDRQIRQRRDARRPSSRRHGRAPLRGACHRAGSAVVDLCRRSC